MSNPAEGRFEYKYLVPWDQLDRLRRALTPFVEVDSFAGAEPDQQYTVRSVYYDTPGLACYVQKEAGIHTRRKIRIRGYGVQNHDSMVVLEIKRKRNILGRKTRAFLPFSVLEELLSTGDVERCVQTRQKEHHAKAQQSARAFLYHLYRYSLFPVILVVYEREAFFGRFDPTVRLTFDKGLRGRAYPPVAELYSEAGLHSVIAEHFILEVKFGDKMPSWAGAILEDFGLERRALSKFAICLESEAAGVHVTSQAAWAAYLPPVNSSIRSLAAPESADTVPTPGGIAWK
jgi:hypothetical protein